MRDVQRRTWLVVAGVAVLALVAAGTGFAVSRSQERDDRLTANRDQLTRACAGLLPAELSSFVPDDSAGVLDEYGTLLAPRQQSRALLDCTLSWGGGGERQEPDAQVRVRAQAVLGRADAPGGDFGSEAARAWEGGRRGTPVEVCVLGPGAQTRSGLPVATSSDDVGGRHRLTAHYGPYAQDERYRYQDKYAYMERGRVPGTRPSGRLPDGGYWVSAVCEKGGERALFTVEPPGSDSPTYQRDGKDKPTSADRAYQRAALKAFAEGSAKAHGCGTPTVAKP